MLSELRKHARALKDFAGYAIKNDKVMPKDLVKRRLVVALENAAATKEQARALKQFLKTYKSEFPMVDNVAFVWIK